MVNSSFAVNPSLRKTLPYDTLKDLAGVTQIANLQLAIVARPDAPFNTLPELIAYAKKNPGKLTYGTPGAGSTTHLGAELLKREAGFDMLHSPFKGSAPAHTELMGGRIDLVVDPFLSVLPYVKAGRMKMIATLGDKRVPGYDYPTVAETAARLQRQRPARLRRAARHAAGGACRRSRPTPRRCWRAPRCASASRNRAWRSSTSQPEQFDAFVAGRDEALGARDHRGQHRGGVPRCTPCHSNSSPSIPSSPPRRAASTSPAAVRRGRAGRSTPAMNQYAVLVWRGQPLTRPAADRLRHVVRPARPRPEAGLQAARSGWRTSA